MLATIGYERASLADFVGTLLASEVNVVVDIRDRAQSRRPGFSKSALTEALEKAGIGYAHFRELGDPKEGREAARQGRFDQFREIFREVMSTPKAKDALVQISEMAKRTRICLLCYERDMENCHRKIVAEHLERVLNCKASHLGVRDGISKHGKHRRVLYSDQGAAAQV